MSVINYYDLLECRTDSTQEEIKRAYRSLALQYHPDKNSSENGTLMFQRIQEAWKVLGDPSSREEYDAVRKQAELDMESIPVYAKLSPSSLVPLEEDEEILTYRCRCGSYYYVEKEDLREENRSIHISCQECTFIIIVET